MSSLVCPGLQLSAAQIEQYRRQGYLSLPHLLSPDLLTEARSALSKMFQRFHHLAVEGKAKYRPAIPGGKGNYDGAHIHLIDHPAYLAYEPGIDPLSMSSAEAELLVRNVYRFQEEDPLFQRLVEHPDIQGVAEQLLGEQAILFLTMALSKPARIGGEKPWHQDNAYFKWVPLEQCIGVWIALDDVAAENGCMHVLPGEHLRGAIKHIHTFDCQITPERMSQQRPVPVPLPAGGAMFFSCLLPHQTPPNRSDKRRRALQFHYRGLSTHEAKPEEYNTVFREADGTLASCEANAPAQK